MNIKKYLHDVSFLILAAVFLTLVNNYGLKETHFGYALIPLIAAYIIGQYVGAKFKGKSNN